MSFDYSNLVGIRYTKRHRIFAFYNARPKRDGSHYVGFFVDDGQTSATVLIRKWERRIAPLWIGDQMKLL